MESSRFFLRFPPTSAFLFFLLLSKAIPGSSQQCLSQTFPRGRSFDHCEDLPQFGAFLHWSFLASSSSLDLAFVAPPASPSGWVSWALNPVGKGMIGAQALLAFRGANGGMTVETFNLTSYSSVQPSPISLEVSGLEADVSGGLMRIFAMVGVPPGKTSINHVWQVGRSMVGSKPRVHGFDHPNLSSKGKLNLHSAVTTMAGTTLGPLERENASSPTDAPAMVKQIHGALSGIGWGILLPISVMLAIAKPENPAWFYVRVACQSFAYIIGIVGLFIGIHLGSQSLEIVYSTHQNIALILLFLCSLQIALYLWKPKEEHKAVWTLLCRLLGIFSVCLGVSNVFIGLNILEPGETWRLAYISLLVVMGLFFCILK